MNPFRQFGGLNLKDPRFWSNTRNTCTRNICTRTTCTTLRTFRLTLSGIVVYQYDNAKENPSNPFPDTFTRKWHP